MQKYVAQLHEAVLGGYDPTRVATEAVALVGMYGDMAELTVDAMLRNLTIADRLGCLTKEGLNDMNRGQSPTITVGPYAGDQLSVDHIIPFSVHPEFDKVIANLELVPLKLNLRKKNKMGQRQLDLLRRFRSAQ